ncbi:regulator of nonsense transcripts 2-like [Oppia nitens]|uniref:regulator of nonsense transcripts 2-like n=1 Tax=Oppia nitens TaxID=1686743 RepID=UPI0023DC858F|nr:regulator of nonsense transcripts 2-like [Oppia nitens]
MDPQMTQTELTADVNNTESTSGDPNDNNEDQNNEELDQKQLIHAFINECEERLKLKQSQRHENSKENIKYPEESFFARLDSSIKKNSTFVKKLKNMTDAQKESIFKDMNGLNLSKYISEVAISIVEAKIKLNEIPMAIKICSALHQRYPDFSGQLLESWLKNFPKKAGDSINASKMRIDIRLFAELISSGIFTLKEGLPVLGNLLTLLTTTDKENHQNLNILLAFCRHCGDDYAGFVPRKMRLLSEKYLLSIPQSVFLQTDRKKGVQNLLREYYRSLCSHVVNDHKQLQNQEKQIRKTLQMKGEIPKERKMKFETKQLDWQKLWSSTQQYADIVDEDLPILAPDLSEFSDDNDDTNATMNFDVSNRFKGQPEFEEGALWEDEDTRIFYQHLPDLKSIIPSILYKDCVKEAEIKSEQNENKDENKDEDKDENKDEVKDENKDEIKTDNDETIIELIDDIVDIDDDITDPAEPVVDIEGDESDDDSTKGAAIKVSNKVLLEQFFNSMLHCVNRDVIDKAAIDFCTNLNTKSNRKKLVRSLFTVPRTRLDLLPFYSRFVAQISPIMPNIATDLVALLKQDFKFLFRKKDQINIESKVKNVRFIGELVKFEIFPKSEALHCFKLLLSDFRHHHIEMTCNLLETCGRYLYRSTDSHLRTKLLLDQMMRKKALLPFGSLYATNIENAYYFANPPESQAITRIERPPIHQYIRKLLYHDLSKANVDKILRQIRKLNWDDPDMVSYTIKCLIAIWNVKFFNVRCVAKLLAGLNSFQEWIAPQLIDGVLEDIRLGMEMNLPKYNQRRISMSRYLGELYNYRLIDSSIVFKVLYSFTTFGVIYDHSVYSPLDPPENLIRIRLICQLLETCGQYFSSGLAKKKLDCFLFFFQKYYWFKRTYEFYNEDNPFHFSMIYLFKDVILLLRPKFKFADSYESASTRVDDLLNELTPKVQEILPNYKLDRHEGHTDDISDEQNSGLTTIKELGESDEIYSSDDEYAPIGQQIEFRQRTTTDDEDNNGSESDANILSDTDLRDPNGPQSGPKVIHCPEDDDFLKDFDKMMSESLVSRSQEMVRSNTDIVIPVNRNQPKKVAFSDNSGLNEIKEETPTINFMIMTKSKGNKPVLKNVDVPIDSEFVATLKAREEEEKAEKKNIKKLILDINERREMEDRDAELEKGTTASGTTNAGYRRKYQHQKGVPDVDIIFGNRYQKR